VGDHGSKKLTTPASVVAPDTEIADGPNAAHPGIAALHQGAYSQITLKGPVATVPQALQVRRLMSVLWLWHGSPVDVVLCVDGTNTGRLLVGSLGGRAGPRPGHHLNLRYLISRNTLAQGAGHER